MMMMIKKKRLSYWVSWEVPRDPSEGRNQAVGVHRGPCEGKDHPWGRVWVLEVGGRPSVDLLRVKAAHRRTYTRTQLHIEFYSTSTKHKCWIVITSPGSCSPGPKLFSLPSGLTEKHKRSDSSQFLSKSICPETKRMSRTPNNTGMTPKIKFSPVSLPNNYSECKLEQFIYYLNLIF